MAYIEKYSKENDKKILKQFVILLGIAAFFSFFMAITSENLRDEWSLILVISFFVIVLFMIISFKTNPLGWIKLFNKKKFEKIKIQSDKVNGILEKLDNRCFVFNWIVMEFFKIDFLIISPYGIYVAAVVDNSEFRVANDTLFNFDICLEKTTAKLWRVANMISIIFKKGFKLDVMPKPVIISFADVPVSLDEYKSIKLLSCNDLYPFISENEEVLDADIAAGFAKFIMERYVFKGRDKKGCN